MENKLIKHTAEYVKNDMPYNDALKDHGNATTYYMEKANDTDNCTTQSKLVICTDINAINESLSNMSLSYKANTNTIQQSRDFLRNKSYISKI